MRVETIRLENKIEIVIIENKNYVEEGTIIMMDVGSINDEIPGEAHLLEHSIYLGTETIQKNEILDEVINNGGVCNGYTANTVTGYYYTVPKEKLKYITEKYIQSILHPKLDREDILEELKNIESESNINKDKIVRKYNDILKSNIINTSRYKNSSIGNIDELKREDIDKILREFHENNYTTENMKVMILTDNSERIKTEIIPIYQQQTKTQGIRYQQTDEEIFKNKGVIYKINEDPNNKPGEMTIYYDIKSKDFNYTMYKYMKYMIERRTEGSLIDILRRNLLAEEVKFNTYDNIGSREIVNIKVKLLERGLKNIDVIITLIDKYIEQIDEKNYENYKRVESMKIKEIKNYIVRNTIESITMKYANRSIINRRLLDILEWEEIDNKVEYKRVNMSISNSMIIYNSYRNKKEEEYKPQEIKEVEEIKSKYKYEERGIKVHLMEEPIKGKINIKDREYEEETITEHNKIITVTSMTTIPSTIVIINLETNIDTISKYVRYRMYTNIIRERIDKELNDDKIYGLKYEINVVEDNINIYIESYNNNIEDIVKIIIDKINNIDIDLVEYNITREEYIKELREEDIIEEVREKIMKDITTSKYEKEEIIKEVYKTTLNDMKSTKIDKIREIRSIIYGDSEYDNIKREISKIKTEQVEDKEEEIKIEEGIKVYKSNKWNNKIIVKNIYTRPVNIYSKEYYKYKVILPIIKNKLTNDFFREFRTEKQYGYVCRVINNVILIKKKIIFVIELVIMMNNNNEVDNNKINEEMDKFIEKEEININNLTEEETTKNKQGIIKRYNRITYNNEYEAKKIFKIYMNNKIEEIEEIINTMNEVDIEEIKRTYREEIVRSKMKNTYIIE